MYSVTVLYWLTFEQAELCIAENFQHKLCPILYFVVIIPTELIN